MNVKEQIIVAIIFIPFILFGLSCYLLIKTKKLHYLNIYVIGYFFNVFLNILLKWLIKDPRPSKDEDIIQIALNKGYRFSFDKYGMPSGHAENCAYSLSFIYFVMKNANITFIYFLLTIMTIMQRYMYNNHTILQLLVGFIIGIIIGMLFYHVNKK
jgi:membrane-associated phospholipid phosphatase